MSGSFNNESAQFQTFIETDHIHATRLIQLEGTNFRLIYVSFSEY